MTPQTRFATSLFTVSVSVLMLVSAGRLHGADGKGLDLDPLLGGAEVWGMDRAAFAKEYIDKKKFASFEWVSSAKDSARLRHLRHWVIGSSDGGSKRLGPTVGGGEHELGEVIVRFKNDKVSRVEMSMYNRGDDGVIPQAEYLNKLREATAFAESKMEGVRREDRRGGRGSTTSGFLWRGKQDFYLLEYSYTKAEPSRGRGFRPEFIILKVAPAPKGGALAVTGKKMKTRSDLKKEVVREKNGDYVIKTVPMVDQGQKGYCAVASAERVMRYYGVDVNQHEMAQLTNTSAWGTRPEEMTKALKAAAGLYHTRVITLFDFDDIEEMEKVAKTYNRLAKRAGKKQFDLKRFWIPITLLLAEGDPETLKATRATGARYERFKSTVYRHIDDGLPVLWALYLGVFKEKGIPQTRGGHMRLIIGYNKSDETLLYTDSWGAGHELKRMKMDEAFTMTMELLALKPAQ